MNEKEIELIGSASNPSSCPGFLKIQQPDVMLLDISLPDGNGIDLCREIKEQYPAIQILGLSTFNNASYVQNMLDNGASGYILNMPPRKNYGKLSWMPQREKPI